MKLDFFVEVKSISRCLRDEVSILILRVVLGFLDVGWMRQFGGVVLIVLMMIMFLGMQLEGNIVWWCCFDGVDVLDSMERKGRNLLASFHVIFN